jgi:ribosomal protein L3 glutamine methyltransferase
VHRVLDLCTGCGCIGIAVARAFPGARVDLADLSEEALAYARRNVARHGLVDRVEVVRSDGFSALAGRRYDLVVCNPPYVSRAEFDTLPAEYRAEPALGLRSGEDGLDLPLRILAGAPAHLAEEGVLVCEVGESREALEALLPRVPFLWPDLVGGGFGVFILDRAQLHAAAPDVGAALEKR